MSGSRGGRPIGGLGLDGSYWVFAVDRSPLWRERRYFGTLGLGRHLTAYRHRTLDEESVAYSGRATVEGHEILRLTDCVAPMLPQRDYDEPEDLARQFELLRDPARCLAASRLRAASTDAG